MQITIREATAQDYDDLCVIIDQVDTLHRGRLPHVFRRLEGPVREREYILNLIEDKDVGLFVAEVEGQLADLVSVAVRDAPSIPVLVPRRLALVDNLAVKQHLRRAGIGRALMRRVHEWALARGATSVELGVYEFNEAAIAFYQDLGYETRSRRMSRPLV